MTTTMAEALISGFIDDELGLDEKIVFVETIHRDEVYTRDTVDLLNQERCLRGEPVHRVPPVVIPSVSRRSPFPWFGRLLFGLGAAAALFILWFTLTPNPLQGPKSAHLSTSHRFVIYRPDIEKAEISGSFTEWHPLAMQRIGASGYWEVNIELAGGEHRFAYILDGDQRMADPTVRVREKDDFGGENSILRVSL